MLPVWWCGVGQLHKALTCGNGSARRRSSRDKPLVSHGSARAVGGLAERARRVRAPWLLPERREFAVEHDLSWITPLMTEEDLNRAQPIGSRWPEPRLLWQADEWLFPSGVRVRLDPEDPHLLGLVLDDVLRNAAALHAQAADDDAWLYAYRAATWWHRELGVPWIGEHASANWIEATDLVRWLRERTL